MLNNGGDCILKGARSIKKCYLLDVYGDADLVCRERQICKQIKASHKSTGQARTIMSLE